MPTYFHGGFPRLRVGEFVLPSSVTGAHSTADHGAEGVCRRDRVYLTTDLQAAKVFAAMFPNGRGWVYQVEPDGELEPDPDCKDPGFSFQCERARVVACCKVKGSERAKIRRSMIRSHQ